jgi:hypothetical protein
MIGCDCGGGHGEGKTGAGGAHVPLQTTTSTCRNLVALEISEPVHCLCSHQCATVAKHLFGRRVRTPSAPTVSALLVLTARGHHRAPVVYEV